ncbi:hypothetical protein VNO77_05725 [Canavalia gladiata]|uniref:AIG1-type G domain-containing protein n=1 Tax=Canavalia gladiata TaxID=3824 RepID=A0AAN9N5G0_CANGL
MGSNSNCVPIRAPPTLDDSEFDVSSNATLSESESEYLSQEEEGYFEVDECAPLVQLSPLQAPPLRVTPFAHLSTYDDGEDEDEEEEMLSVVKVPENFVAAPRVKEVDSEEQNTQTLMLMNLLPDTQSFLANEFTFSDDMGSQGLVVDEHGLRIRVASDEDEHSCATDTDVLSQCSQDRFNDEQFRIARVVFNELQNIGVNDLQEQNSQVRCIMTGEPLSEEAFAENIEYSTATQRIAVNGSPGFASESDPESECENLVSITKSVLNSEAELHDNASVGFEFNDAACEGDKIQSVESSLLFDPVLLQECTYLENGLSKSILGVGQEDELFCDYHLQQNVGTLDLGDNVKEEAFVELNTLTQESKTDGSASDGDVEEFMSVGLEQFREQISALSILLGSKVSGINSQDELSIRSPHGTMNLPMDDAKGQLIYACSGGESDGSTDTVTSPDESGVIFLKDPASISSFPYYNANTTHNITENEKQKIQKMLTISVKFLRLVWRINLSLEDSLVANVLCRLVADIERRSNQEFIIKSAKISAKKLEENCQDDLDFSLNILVLGRSGVGKSATINSIFGDMKVMTSAFEPATTSVTMVSGTMDGIKIRILDTPGLKSPMKEQAYNRKILSSIKRYMKKFSPYVILYIDRVDAQTRDLNDLPILRSITSSLGPSIWQHAILTLTHAASNPLDGPSGSPLSYEVFVAQKSYLVQQSITRAVGHLCQLSPSFMFPVALVENHPLSGKNIYGDCVLPNGLRWRSQLLTLCFSLKILSEVSSVSGPQTLFDHWKHIFFQDYSRPLSHIFSSLLQSPPHLKFSANWN